MQNIGTIAILLLFGMGFALYVGSGGEYGVGFIEFWNAIEGQDINSIIELIVNSLTSTVTIGTAAIAAVLGMVNSQSIRYAAGIVVLTALASIFLTPFTFYKDIPLPTEITWLIQGFFNLVLLIAILQFITEKEW